jgi:hypothetical protein
MMRKTTYEFDSVLHWFRQLRSNGFFGTVTIGMQNGEITSVEPKAHCKPGEPLPVFQGRIQSE